MELIENLIATLASEGDLAACLLVFALLGSVETWCLANMAAGLVRKIGRHVRHRRAERDYPYSYVFEEFDVEAWSENRRIEKLLERANLKIRLRKNMVG